jgi:hypothetical protein
MSTISYGRPVGIPREGTYGKGVRTVLFRIPASYSDLDKDVLRRLIIDFKDFLDKRKSLSRNTPEWTHANDLISELEALFPLPSLEDQPKD